jgi:hypothetical protein
VGLLMAAVVVEMERIMTVREVFGLSCRMNWRGWMRRMKTSFWSRNSRQNDSRQNDSRQNDGSGWMRRKMKRRKGGDSESNSGD